MSCLWDQRLLEESALSFQSGFGGLGCLNLMAIYTQPYFPSKLGTIQYQIPIQRNQGTSSLENFVPKKI